MEEGKASFSVYIFIKIAFYWLVEGALLNVVLLALITLVHSTLKKNCCSSVREAVKGNFPFLRKTS